ncbi:magnesium/cobalt transporter CorA [Dongia soli]|uniref:Magnesium transport protein CorA n=1 Tax=Dongia soli TaxID=600628 RepID=A0ABU5EA97_9PROT|nr:magnesium/cobalt transporter CorA [Dongia soli]MDY0882714.1 magnesium/cobalt transporter CorA [Dongia soli]
MNSVVNCAVYENGRKVRDLDINHLEQMKILAGQLIWIGLLEPSQEMLAPLQRQFGLHELAVEDAYRAHQRPKLEVYGDTVFVVMKTCQWLDGELALGETCFFVGRGYLISVRHGKSLSYRSVRERCENVPGKLKKGEDFILYALMDFIVDNYFPVIDALEEKVEELEGAIFENRDQHRDILSEISILRRDLLAMRHAVAPLPDICQRIIRFDVPAMDKNTQPYFRDIYDHANILMDRIEALRETVKSVVDSKMLMVSMRQNEVMRKLAAWAAMLAVPTAIAGIYGMNFTNMPELTWRYGYFTVLGVIVVICLALYWRFKRSGWL